MTGKACLPALRGPKVRHRAGLPGLALPCTIFAGAVLAGSALANAPPWSEAARGASLDVETLDLADPADRDRLVARGEHLFIAKFTDLDGAGRPMATQAIVPTKRRRPSPMPFQRLAGPDANACASCHHDPVIGGAGPFTANAFVTEGFESADFDTLDPQFSNERGTNHLFGAGLVELLAREMTADLQAARDSALREARQRGETVEADLVSKGVAFGSLTARPDGRIDLSKVDGVDTDLVIRPFSQKGVMTSLRQFTVNAMNHHHGMQAEERFGPRWTGDTDFDADGVSGELSHDDITALVAWQATRPPPGRRRGLPPDWQALAEDGEDRFSAIGCAACHVPALPLETAVFTDPNPFDTAGTLRPGETTEIALDLSAGLARDDQGRLLVPLFGDLKRHRIADDQRDWLGNELLSQRFVDRDVFQTTELWGVGSTAPYGHRGDLTTLDAAIRAHAGSARDARQAYEALDEPHRQSIIAFLKTLVIE